MPGKINLPRITLIYKGNHLIYHDPCYKNLLDYDEVDEEYARMSDRPITAAVSSDEEESEQEEILSSSSPAKEEESEQEDLQESYNRYIAKLQNFARYHKKRRKWVPRWLKKAFTSCCKCCNN